MAKIIKQRERKYHERVCLNFYEKDTNEIRFGFPVTNGTIIPLDENGNQCSEKECNWWNNYIKAKGFNSLYSVMETEKLYYTEPAVAICECGKEIALNYDAEECPHCGRLHNLFGQELRPRKYWNRDWDCDNDADDWCE